jgi:hypothetical protein
MYWYLHFALDELDGCQEDGSECSGGGTACDERGKRQLDFIVIVVSLSAKGRGGRYDYVLSDSIAEEERGCLYRGS